MVNQNFIYASQIIFMNKDGKGGKKPAQKVKAVGGGGGKRGAPSKVKPIFKITKVLKR